MSTVWKRRFNSITSSRRSRRSWKKELAGLRQEILAHINEAGQTEAVFGSYKVKLVTQNRKEYDDDKLYQTLSDPELWRLLSRADPAKVASLTKLKVIAEEKNCPYLRCEDHSAVAGG
ncbi:hypothetical protein ACFTAO_19330 [Paenibacillus rhizoplanae]